LIEQENQPMAYDTDLEAKIDSLTSDWDLAKKKMFGGIGYLLSGNMAFGIHKDELILRADEKEAESLLKQEGIRLFDMTGRPMKNWLMAEQNAWSSDDKLEGLLKIGRDFASGLPPK
jgi:TfoX/Sxy family transcriptional regulator of competence genes